MIGVVLKSFGVNNICLHSYKNFDVYVHRERVVTKRESVVLRKYAEKLRVRALLFVLDNYDIS